MEYCFLERAAKSKDKKQMEDALPIMDKYMNKRFALFDRILNNQPERLNPEDRDYCSFNYCTKLFLIMLRGIVDKMLDDKNSISDSLNSAETQRE